MMIILLVAILSFIGIFIFLKLRNKDKSLSYTNWSQQKKVSDALNKKD